MELAVLLSYSNLQKIPEYPCKDVGILENPLLQKSDIPSRVSSHPLTLYI
jgi:hypothetical protein